MEGYEDGNWVGLMVFNKVIVDMCIYIEEVFGLVFFCMLVDLFDDVLILVNNNFYGNGIFIFINSGVVVWKY